MTTFFPIRWFALAALFSAGSAAAQEKADRFGDPLPPGAIARLGTVRFRHAAGVDDFAFAPDGKSLASIDNLGAIVVWEIPTGKPLYRKAGSKPPESPLLLFLGGTRQIAFANDGKTVVYMDRYKPERWLPGSKPVARAADPEKFGFHFAEVFPQVPRNRISRHGQYVVLSPTDSPFSQRAAGAKTNVELLDSCGKQIAAFSFMANYGESALRKPLNAAFSADEKKVAIAVDNATILVYDIKTKNERRLKGHQGPCTALAFSPDGKTLISAGEFVHEWNLATRKVIRRVEACPEHDDPASEVLLELKVIDKAEPKYRDKVSQLTFAPDGKHFAVEVDYRVTMWDAKTLKPGWSVPTGGGSVAFSPDGKYLAVLGTYRKIRLLAAGTGRQINPDNDAADVGLLKRFSADGKTIFAEPTDRSWLVTRFEVGALESVNFDLWNPTRGEPIGQIRYPLRGVDDVTFSANGRWAVTQTSRLAKDRFVSHIKIWDTATRKLVRALPPPTVSEGLQERFSNRAQSIALAEAGNRLALVHEAGLSVWNLDGPAKAPAWTLSPKADEFLSIWDIAFSPDGKLLKVQKRSNVFMSSSIGIRSWHTEVRFHDAATGKLLDLFAKVDEGDKGTFAGYWHRSIFSPDSRLLASNCRQSHYGVQLWDLQRGQLLRRLVEDRRVDHFVFAPDSRSLAIADETGRISIWDCATGGLKQQWQAHRGSAKAILYSPDGHHLISQSAEGAALVWDLSVVAKSKNRRQK